MVVFDVFSHADELAIHNVWLQAIQKTGNTICCAPLIEPMDLKGTTAQRRPRHSQKARCPAHLVPMQFVGDFTQGCDGLLGRFGSDQTKQMDFMLGMQRTKLMVSTKLVSLVQRPWKP